MYTSNFFQIFTLSSFYAFKSIFSWYVFFTLFDAIKTGCDITCNTCTRSRCVLGQTTCSKRLHQHNVEVSIYLQLEVKPYLHTKQQTWSRLTSSDVYDELTSAQTKKGKKTGNWMFRTVRSPRGFSLVSPCDYFCMWRPRYLILWPRLTVTSDSVTSYIWLKIWNSVRGSSPLTRWGTVKHTANKLWHPTGKFQNHINHHKVNASKQIWIKEYDHDEPYLHQLHMRRTDPVQTSHREHHCTYKSISRATSR